jgi:urease subunit gamma/beta
LGGLSLCQWTSRRQHRLFGSYREAVRLTPTERDRLLLFSAAELARSRRARGLKLNVPEATAIIADTVAERARDGARLLDAALAGRSVLSLHDVLPGVASIVTEVKVEAVFDDGTRLVVVRDPFRLEEDQLDGSVRAIQTSGNIDATDRDVEWIPNVVELIVTNRGEVPVSITSHFHFFEINARLDFDRMRAYGMRLAIDAGAVQRFEPHQPTYVRLRPVQGERVAIGFAGLVDGPLDAPGARERALERAKTLGYLGASSPVSIVEGSEGREGTANSEGEAK